MDPKPILASKTIWYSLALILLGVLQQIADVLPTFIQEQYLGFALAGLGVIGLVLRFLTGKPLVKTAGNDGGFVRLRLVLVLCLAAFGLLLLPGCGAMSMQAKNGWATMGKTAGCESARLLCISLGGSPELCGAVGSGCGSIGGAVVHRYLPRSSPATSAEVGAEAARAMASSPLRSTFKVKRAPGFTTPGASTDSKPLEIR